MKLRRSLSPLLLLVSVAAYAGVLASPLPHPPRHGNVYVICHRGAHENIPENTLAAYQKAIDFGADFVEIDVRTTKDGQFVSCHNDKVDDYTKDAKGFVKDFTLKQLKAMDIGSRIGPQWKNERIPTFEEILNLCKGKIGIYLDLKDAPVDQLVKMIRAHGMENDVIWYASRHRLHELEKDCPKCFPMPDPGPQTFLPRVMEEFKPKVVASRWKYYSEDFAKACHKDGAIVMVDILKDNDKPCWDKALAWHTDGIQTNRPAELIAYLDKHAAMKK